MAPEIAKLFMNGGSQAVRLPAEFRFEGVDEVYVRRDAITGDLILSAKPSRSSWQEFFSLREQVTAPADFLQERPLNRGLDIRDPFEGS
jgi:antitoxin VapB